MPDPLDYFTKSSEPPRPRVSRLAVAAFVVAIFACPCLWVALVVAVKKILGLGGGLPNDLLTAIVVLVFVVGVYLAFTAAYELRLRRELQGRLLVTWAFFFLLGWLPLLILLLMFLEGYWPMRFGPGD